MKQILFGNHEIATWIGCLVWSLIGALGVKLKYLPSDLEWKDFKFSYWINKNALDFIKAIVLSVIILRIGGDLSIKGFEYFVGEKLPFKIDDIVVLSFFIAVLTQNYLHKSKRKKVE